MWLLAAAEILEREVGKEGHDSGLDSGPVLCLERYKHYISKKIGFFLSCYVILSSFLNWWCSVCKLIEIIW
jgi:hypothetical protein